MELLKKLTDSFNRMGREFYVIGATARDIIIRQLIGTTSGRKTKDLDIAIAIGKGRGIQGKGAYNKFGWIYPNFGRYEACLVLHPFRRT